MQMPFDRLCQTVDKWAASRTEQDIFMQIGSTTWRPQHTDYVQMLDPNGYANRIKESSILVMHAGIGSILAAMQYEKPIIVMPRRAKLKETRNDHQVATARMFTKLGGGNIVAINLSNGSTDHDANGYTAPTGAGQTVDGISNTNLGRAYAFEINVEPVPEPSTTALLGLGGLALILRRRK